MSYDYTALLEKIQLHRKAEEWQESVETFGTLSTSCPMTPLLWIQYAHDAAKIFPAEDAEDGMKVRLDTLELGLAEFPGCALLQLHYVENLTRSTSFNTAEKILEGLENAVQAVGKGSHCNEDVLIVQIYRQCVDFKVRINSPEEAVDIFLQRALTPMKKGNEALQNELEIFLKEHNLNANPKVLDSFEKGRRQAEMYFGMLKSFEDDVDEAMETEHILSRYRVDLDNINWNELISVTSHDCWMGLGSVQTAQSFIKYAKACSRKAQKSEEQHGLLKSLTFPIYERGVAECPTVECLWKSYIHDLSWLVEHGQAHHLASNLENVASRAVSNCPYSLYLAQLQLGTFLTLAGIGHCILDPDTLMKRVALIIKDKFLTSASHHLELYMTAIRIVKRRILCLLVRQYDEFYDDKAEQNLPITALSDAQEEEIQDLIEDLREMYDTVDEFLRRSKWQEGRYLLSNERCKTEAYMLTPLLQVMDGAQSVTHATEPFRCLEQLVKIKPQHPDCYRSQIQVIMSQPPVSANDIGLKYRKVRYHYRKALKAISSKSDPLLDSAKHNLCQEFMEFEQVFGSEKSKNAASRLINDKFRNRNQNQFAQNASDSPRIIKVGKKRKQIEEHVLPQNREEKKIKIADLKPVPTTQNSGNNVGLDSNLQSDKPHFDGSDAYAEKEKASGENNATTATNDASLQPPKLKEKDSISSKAMVLKVKVGKMEYPVHPFTVRVLNLAPEVQDMDLVDLLRPKCGAIVHAKIIRDKQHHHGKGRSKGWGLVQFEEIDSVEKALALNDLIGLHEKLLQIDRSHMPAASLVPPGMHRINPKGGGKVSKRNQKKKEFKKAEEVVTESSVPDSKEGPEAKNEISTAATLLSLQPRGVARKTNRKAKLTLK